MTSRRVPTAPKGLGAAGKALWRAIHADVADGWELDAKDLGWLTLACQCADDAVALERAVEKDGRIVHGSKGQPREHPALGTIVRLRALEASLLSKLELSPPAAKTPLQVRAAKAAATRWAAHRGAG